MPHLQRLSERLGPDGLVVIGVHTKSSAEKLPGFVAKERVRYPVCVDADEKTNAAYRVDSYPDYYLIDRMGNLRVADLANDDLERAVTVLLDEAGPTPPTREGRAAAAVEAQPGFVLETREEGELVRTSTIRYAYGRDTSGPYLEQSTEVASSDADAPTERVVARVRPDAGFAFDSWRSWGGPVIYDLRLERQKLVGESGTARVLRNVTGLVAAEPLLVLHAASLAFEPGAELPLTLVRAQKRGATVSTRTRLVYAGLDAPRGNPRPLHRVDLHDDRSVELSLWFDVRRRLVAYEQPGARGAQTRVAPLPVEQDER